MFDGASLKGWKETPFSGRGKIGIADGAILLGNGSLTGVTWTGALPKANYEVRLEAMRVEGYDFFAGITFPVNDSFLLLDQSADGAAEWWAFPASTTWMLRRTTPASSRNFENGQWYALRLRVTHDRIQAWIDDQPVIDTYYRAITSSACASGISSTPNPSASRPIPPPRSCGRSNTAPSPNNEAWSQNPVTSAGRAS